LSAATLTMGGLMALAAEPPALTAPQSACSATSSGVAQPRRSGSLFKASLSSRERPANGKEPHLSFTYVAEPEPKSLKKHDLVTIIIREESEVKADSKTESHKADAMDAKVDAMLKIMSSRPFVTGGGIGDTPPQIKMSGARDFTGDAKAERTDSFTTRITAEVIDVKPNNTLVLQATKKIKHDDEEQKLILTGVCRVEDISPDNSVLSTQLYDMNLDKQNTGAVRDGSKQGWFGKAFDFINPF
jgi:flagellar L-ring protein precursor FlgH